MSSEEIAWRFRRSPDIHPPISSTDPREGVAFFTRSPEVDPSTWAIDTDVGFRNVILNSALKET